MILSPFTPLFFPSAKADGIESTYTQMFSAEDVILVELFGLKSENIDFQIRSVRDNQSVAIPDFETHLIDDSLSVHVSKFKLLPGYYTARLGDKKSAIFMVTDDDNLLHDTVLLQYSPADNKTRADVVSIINNTRLFFSFRVPGGFKDAGWTFSVNNEQFVTEDGDIIELYARESTQKVLTIGNSAGVPIWFGQMVNRLFTSKYVYIDGQRFARFEGSVPEKEQVLEGVNSFIFSQKVQQINNIDTTIDNL